jgi:hypothetical protein
VFVFRSLIFSTNSLKEAKNACQASPARKGGGGGKMTESGTLSGNYSPQASIPAGQLICAFLLRTAVRHPLKVKKVTPPFGV